MKHPHQKPRERRALDRFLKLREVVDIASLSKATVYRLMERGEFPKPVKQGRSSRWSSLEIHDYIESLKKARTDSEEV